MYRFGSEQGVEPTAACAVAILVPGIGHLECAVAKLTALASLVGRHGCLECDKLLC